MDQISEYVQRHGPTRSSEINRWLVTHEGLTADAARKRISRIKPPLRSFPIPLFPKGERFIYLQTQRNEERFWVHLQRDLRATNSVFGAALDGLIARQGIVPLEDFAAISSGTVTPQRGQLTAATIEKRMDEAGIVERQTLTNGQRYVVVRPNEYANPNWDGLDARRFVEKITLEALRDWVKKMGLASFNSVRIRGEPELKPIGAYAFDLGGPSYLLAVRGGRQPGFFVADVIADGILDEYQVRYFLRKAAVLHSTLKEGGLLAMLIAEGFTGPALTAGHKAGVMLVTPKELFGNRAGRAIHTLLETLQNAAAYAASSPERLTKLIDDLSEIEGSAANLRGPLFELLVAYLSRRDAVSIDMGVRARHIKTGETADIDVLKITAHTASCTAIECKAKVPGSSITREVVEDWIRRIPIFQSHLRAQSNLREADLKFELWASGPFEPNALVLLENEKSKRTKFLIDWKDGEQVLALARKHKEKAVADSLSQHFMRHPLSDSRKSLLRTSRAKVENGQARSHGKELRGD